MYRFLSSGKATAVIFLSIVIYQIQGRYMEGMIQKKVMMALSALLFLQSAAALSSRLLKLSGATRATDVQFAMQNPTALNTDINTAFSKLQSLGLRPYFELAGTRCLARREVAATAIESIAYASLLFALVSGLINYGYRLEGAVSMSQGSEPVSLQTALRDRGFMVKDEYLAYRLHTDKLQHATAKQPSRLAFKVYDESGKTVMDKELDAGETGKLGRLNMKFRGDIYSAILFLRKGGLDYQPGELVLYSMPSDDGASLYKGKLVLHEPGASGDVVYDPDAGTFKFRIYLNDKLEFEHTLEFGKEVRDRGYEVQVTALGHFGILKFWWLNYRNWVLGGLAVAIAALVSRAFLRPEKAFLWHEEGDRVFFYSSSRRLRNAFLN